MSTSSNQRYAWIPSTNHWGSWIPPTIHRGSGIRQPSYGSKCYKWPLLLQAWVLLLGWLTQLGNYKNEHIRASEQLFNDLLWVSSLIDHSLLGVFHLKAGANIYLSVPVCMLSKNGSEQDPPASRKMRSKVEFACSEVTNFGLN